jgi:protein-disulfide isomerase
MENRNMDDERWVADRLRTLDPANDWTPNAAGAFARLRRKDSRRHAWQRNWIWSAAMASVAVIAIALPSRATCAIAGLGCRPPVTAVRLAPAVAVAPLPSTPAPLAAAKYKESGSPDAPVVCEIYSDYECPACGVFYRDVFPRLMSEYVRSGKVRVVHRDFPLPMHPFARLAARYANAAGELGLYEPVFRQLFASQPEWAGNGNVDAAVAHVVPADIMLKIRALVDRDPALDASVAADLSMVAQDLINQTPTIVFVSKGRRRKAAGVQSFDLLRSYLEEMLAK